MIDTEKLRKAEDFIAQEVQKHCATRTDELTWEQGPYNKATKIHKLVVSRGGQKSVFTFTEYELLENYGSKESKVQLHNHVNDILTEL